MESIQIIDLKFLETKDAIASFLIQTEIGPILIESGPESTFSALKKSIEELGFDLKDIQHVLLTHIHFDHAGAAWKLAELGAKIYVHPLGKPHLESPEKLWNSAKQIYVEEMDRLWGQMQPIPENQLIAVKDGEVLEFGTTRIKSLHTPGHAIHHIAWNFDGNIFTGDVAGVKIDGGPVVPPCPPPDINIEAWKNSLTILKAEKPKALYLTHFGRITEIDSHLNSLSDILEDWANWFKPHYEKGEEQELVIPKFMEYTQSQLKKGGCSETQIQVYEYANPSWMSVAGLYRYWKLKFQGRI
ncbi:MBL fold metallo-hydrolase [Cecembia rubra]|uniref:Glyoxylase-like metal-dependent hydrolase (Beta-lactamase superfamily II) n=1 Tax=Cecembia rubra TaxID=1485585 RepID=A0A2P8E628_9BACT|nr:MBL fold metallo-hydrolase [Cecembia rubra]PSL04921.1 glyoxylase-like metal-dependent hydrolase (beta-lactamase superfamily II) [Cecembia rubra]